jgi:hypothetical protein
MIKNDINLMETDLSLSTDGYDDNSICRDCEYKGLQVCIDFCNPRLRESKEVDND